MNQIDKAISNLSSPNKNKRYEACEELRVADSLPEPAIAALEAATHYPDPLVAEAARRALAIHKPPSPEEDSPSTNQESLIQETQIGNNASSISLALGVLSVALLVITLVKLPFGCSPFCGELYVLIFFALFWGALCIIFALTAITSGIVSLAKIKKSGVAGKGVAIAGIALGIVSIIAQVLLWLFLLLFKLH